MEKQSSEIVILEIEMGREDIGERGLFQVLLDTLSEIENRIVREAAKNKRASFMFTVRLCDE